MRFQRSSLFACLSLVPISISLADGGPQHQVKQNPPVQMGTSGGSVNDRSSAFCCGGTLGALVLRDGVTHILSNNHVLARSGSATNGEDTVQPGLIDSNCSGTNSNIVGDFAGNIVPLGSANVDAALSIARTAMVDTSGAILDIGVPSSVTQAPAIGMPVRKSGRTTGFTTGNITSINTSVQIQYQRGCNQGKKFNVVFTNQVVTGAMSAGGDSGSVLFSNNDTTPNPVGLLFAGSSATTIYNPIQDVVNAFTAGGHTFSFVGSPGASPEVGDNYRTPSATDIENALRVKTEHEFNLFRNRRVLGVGIGASESDPTQAVIVIYVEDTDGTIPPRIPTVLDGVPVRVILTDKFVAQ